MMHELVPMLASHLSSPGMEVSQHLPAKFILKQNLRVYLIMQLEHLPLSSISDHLNTVVVKLQNLQ